MQGTCSRFPIKMCHLLTRGKLGLRVETYSLQNLPTRTRTNLPTRRCQSVISLSLAKPFHNLVLPFLHHITALNLLSVQDTCAGLTLTLLFLYKSLTPVNFMSCQKDASRPQTAVSCSHICFRSEIQIQYDIQRIYLSSWSSQASL